jgi:predicted AAA+ superfamily ATPase
VVRGDPVPECDEGADRSFFLFGPRGTGKSTWIRAAIKSAASYDLLDASESIRLAGRADMQRLYPLVSAEMGTAAAVSRSREA